MTITPVSVSWEWVAAPVPTETPTPIPTSDPVPTKPIMATEFDFALVPEYAGNPYVVINNNLPFKNMVADYVKETNQHVLYRVTPVFVGNELLSRGVLMEGRSVEDDEIEFCVFFYNVQPDIDINYATGESREVTPETEPPVQQKQEPAPAQTAEPVQEAQEHPVQESNTLTYVLNTNTRKFHYSSCRDVRRIKQKNYSEFTGTREEVIAQGYDPCGHCNP